MLRRVLHLVLFERMLGVALEAGRLPFSGGAAESHLALVEGVGSGRGGRIPEIETEGFEL